MGEDARGWRGTDLIVEIEVLGERVTAGCNGFIVGHKDGVVEQTGIPSIGLQGRRGHRDCFGRQ